MRSVWESLFSARSKKVLRNEDSGDSSDERKNEMAQMYINEKSIMSSISHPFVVQLHNTFKTREYIFFLMEYVDGESLRAFLEQKQKNELLKKNADDFLSDF